MIRERLRELTMGQLQKLADRYEVDGSPDTTREELVELVAEAIDEFRLEREAGNDYPIAIQEKKYECYIDAVLDGADSREPELDDWELPEQYNETRVVLLLRDPCWAYVYWEINESHMATLAEECASAAADRLDDDEGETEAEFDGVALRVHELPSMAADLGEALFTFTIPVQLEDRSWYINLPSTGTFYRVSVVAHTRDCAQTLAVSNTIEVPPGDIAPPAAGTDDTAVERILKLSSLDDLPVETYSHRMPQRIISLQDE